MSKNAKNKAEQETKTDCEAHLQEANRCIRKAITDISSVVISECDGVQNLTPSRITDLRAVMNTLVDIRDKHFTDWHKR
ncbi:hypothetical protein [Lacunisphaera limnophila]|uniref:hypothetical protein n=1 Tax=Lacunisphaera limnophila TaxID=1838286 RepID=UPI0012FE177A|nr:hypothetical protein [Lacunisphaera limnophila]